LVVLLQFHSAQADGAYDKVDGHIGCHSGGNLGFIGRPRDFLNDVSSKCTGGDKKNLMFHLEESLNSVCRTCWGFAVHNGWGVQIYNSKASNTDKCNGKYGLQENSDWTTYKKSSDCPVLENYKKGGYHCPGNKLSNCLNGNTPYASLEAAWKKCGEIDGCKKIMRWKSDGKFYQRRSTDDYADGYDYGNQYLDYTCQEQ